MVRKFFASRATIKRFSRHVFGSTKQENSGAQTDRSSGMQKGMTRSVRHPKEPDGNQIMRMQEFPNVVRPFLAGSGGEQPDSNGAEVASIGTGRKEHKAETAYVATNTGGRLCRTAGVYRSKQ